MFAGSLAVFSAIFFRTFSAVQRGLSMWVCVWVCYRFPYTRMNFYSICKATTSCTIAVLNTRTTSQRASERASERAFRHSGPSPARTGPARKRPGKPLLKITQNPPGKATPSTTIFVFPSSTYISRHCHLHVQLSAFRSRSFKCSSRCLTLFFCNFSALVLLFLFFCFWFFVLFLENFTIYLFMRWLQFGIL